MSATEPGRETPNELAEIRAASLGADSHPSWGMKRVRSQCPCIDCGDNLPPAHRGAHR